jgi:hypothetical protein
VAQVLVEQGLKELELLAQFETGSVMELGMELELPMALVQRLGLMQGLERALVLVSGSALELAEESELGSPLALGLE